MNWKYTNILHGPRLDLGITPNEYCVLDLYYKTQTSPKFSVDGWAENTYADVAAYLGFSKGAVHKMVSRFVDAGLMEVNPANSKQKRTCEAWYGVAYEDVQKVNAEETPVQKVNAKVSKVNEPRSKSERHIEEYKEEYKENTHTAREFAHAISDSTNPVEAPLTPSPDSAPPPPPDDPHYPYSTGVMNDFLLGGDAAFQNIMKRVGQFHKDREGLWLRICRASKVEMTAEEYREEIEAWVSYNCDKSSFYCQPTRNLERGKGSLWEWFNRDWRQEKYNPIKNKRAVASQEQERAPQRQFVPGKQVNIKDLV